MKKFLFGFLFTLSLAVLLSAPLAVHGASQASDIPPPPPGAVALPAGSTPPPTTPLGESVSNERMHEYLVNSTFGPTICQTDELSKETAKGLRSECDNWVKERKIDLGNKYIAGTCTQACEECQYHLRRCSYKGTVHYEH